MPNRKKTKHITHIHTIAAALCTIHLALNLLGQLQASRSLRDSLSLTPSLHHPSCFSTEVPLSSPRTIHYLFCTTLYSKLRARTCTDDYLSFYASSFLQMPSNLTKAMATDSLNCVRLEWSWTSYTINYIGLQKDSRSFYGPFPIIRPTVVASYFLLYCSSEFKAISILTFLK